MNDFLCGEKFQNQFGKMMRLASWEQKMSLLRLKMAEVLSHFTHVIKVECYDTACSPSDYFQVKGLFRRAF
jgi:hypothetical protein